MLLLLLLRRAPRALDSGPSERQHLLGSAKGLGYIVLSSSTPFRHPESAAEEKKNGVKVAASLRRPRQPSSGRNQCNRQGKHPNARSPRPARAKDYLDAVLWGSSDLCWAMGLVSSELRNLVSMVDYNRNLRESQECLTYFSIWSHAMWWQW